MATSRRRLAGALFTALTGAALLLPGSVAAAGPSLSQGLTGNGRFVAPDWAANNAKIKNGVKPTGRVAIFIELATTSSADAFTTALSAGEESATSASKAAAANIARTSGAVFQALHKSDPSAIRIFSTHNAVGGLGVMADAGAIRKLAARRDVRGLWPMSPKHTDNAHAAQLTRVLQAWQDTGLTGAGVTIGDIDSGTDYTHANFGGPGTVEAFESVDPTGPTPYFPSAKVVGGTDLAGENYNADSDDPANFIPVPDGNPLDCDGHGSHTAGTATGLGVNDDGSTFTGDYSALTASDLNNMRIGPGMAPKASLYSVKVFGCPDGGAGSTFLVAPGIDWMMDPNQDGNISDHVDLMTISIGGDYGAPDDPEALFVRNAFNHGVAMVLSAGNAGDLYDAAGSPGNTPEALTVASSRDNYELLDAITVNSPAPDAGDKPGQNSVLFDYSDSAGVTADVKSLTGTADDPDNLDGCDPITTDLTGRIAWLKWDDNDASRRCGSVARSGNAEAAGAVGVLLTAQHNHFLAGISGSPNIPVFQMTKDVTDALQATADAGTLNVFMGATSQAHAFDFIDNSIQDTPSGFTSRGTRNYFGIKPDVAAPGDTIVSTGMGTGNHELVESGTSMATPHVAGIVALLIELHPDWTAAELKAAIMDTANHDIWSQDGPSGPIEGPNRTGTGRVDGLAATGNWVLAADSQAPEKVSLNFVTQPLTAASAVLSRQILLTNKSGTAASYNTSYESATDMPGATFTVLQSSVTVPANGTATVTVRLTLNRDAMRKVADPTIAKEQSFFGIADLPRQFLADESGRVIFTPTAGADYPLRVAVYADPKPAADIQVPGKLKFASPNSTSFLELSGRGLYQGAAGCDTHLPPNCDEAYVSAYNVSELGATSPKLKSCAVHPAPCALNRTARGGDLRYVGAGTDAPSAVANDNGGDAFMWFTIATWNGWYNIGSNTIPFVDIDVDADGLADFETFVWRQPDTDLLWARTDNLVDGIALWDLEPINFQFGDFDTNTFNTNVISMPVYLDALGIDAASEASHRITYQAGVAGFYSAPGEPLIDLAKAASYDPLKPGLWAEDDDEALLFVAQPGTGLLIHRDATALKKDPYAKLLTVNFHNAGDARIQITKAKVVAP